MRCAADVLVGTSSGSQSLSLSQSLTLRISPLSFRSLSLWVPFSLSDTLHCRKKLTFPSLDSVPLSLSLSISLTHTKRHRHWKLMERRTKNPPSFFYIRNNAPLLQQNAKRIGNGMD